MAIEVRDQGAVGLTPKPPVNPDPLPREGGPGASQTTISSSKSTAGSMKSESRYRTSKIQETVIHTLMDDGQGGLGEWGVVNYSAKQLSVRLVSLDSKTDGYKSDYEDSSSFESSTSTGGVSSGSGSGSTNKGGEYVDNAVSEELLANSTVSVTYATGSGAEIESVASFAPPSITIDLCPYTSDYVVPGSVRFTWMGHVYEDYEGDLIRDRTSANVGFFAGRMNYSTGIAEVSDYVVSGNPSDFTLDSLWTVRQNWNTASIFMRTEAAPIKPSGFVMNLVDAQGDTITAMSGNDGIITGPHLRGRIEYATGEVEMQFGDYLTAANLTDEQKVEWWYDPEEVGAVEPGKIWRPWPVDPTTLRYNSVSFFYLPLDADLLGLDPVRLPSDGRVPIFRAGGFAVVGHTGRITETVSNGQIVDCGRVRLSRVRVVGADGKVIHTGYTTDLEAGLVTFTNTAGYEQPVTVEHRIEDMAVVRDVQINGDIAFTRALTHDYPVPGSYVSSALVAGDLFARVSTVFDQQTWNNTWSDTVQGAAATASFNHAAFPIVVSNKGALTERWAIRFTSNLNFEVIGENVGVIATGNTGTDCAPINPNTGAPYFTIPALGWGSGWATGNVLRLNTIGAQLPLWVVRTVQQGPETVTDDYFTLLVRGDVDTP